MAEKIFNGRIVQKHDTAFNWAKATSFVPKQGEVIIYDIDSTYTYERIKIGDGVTNVNSLPFVDDVLRTELLAQINAIDGRVDALSALVGDKKVSEQINTAIAAIPVPDVSGQIESHNTSGTAHNDMRTSISNLSALVGNESVSNQISNALADAVISDNEIDAICGMTIEDANSIALVDDTTGVAYQLYVIDGKLKMKEMYESADPTSVNHHKEFIDISTDDVYKLYVCDGELTMMEVE